MKKKIGYIVFALLILNMFASTITGAVKNTDLTKMELFMKVPQHFIWNFDSAEKIPVSIETADGRILNGYVKNGKIVITDIE